jgi:hypothetical protein
MLCVEVPNTLKKPSRRSPVSPQPRHAVHCTARSGTYWTGDRDVEPGGRMAAKRHLTEIE